MPACTEANNLNILNTHAITLYLLKNCLMGLHLKYYYNAMGTSLLHKINNLIHVLIKIEMHKFIICIFMFMK